MSVRAWTLLFATVVLWLLPRPALPDGADWFPGGTYDPRVPTIEQVLGFEPPERFTSFYETEKLLHAWAEVVPDRARLIEFGEDYEGKKLYLLVVSSPENIRRLDEIREALGKLADPRRLSGASELDRIVESTPATFLISTIDTSEASTVEAMQLIAYQLLAGTDELSERIRREVVTYVVPVENPSPRERYVAWYNSERSVLPKADRHASEHQPPWGIGTDNNHYQLDPNRDGVSMLMQETRAKAALMREWRPQVALDVHEMGVDSTFFFPPYPEPYNKNLPIETLHAWWELYASDLRKEFDQRGWRYFSGDAFGSPFLGMHTLYTQYLGAIGILFEQAAGEGGLIIERGNGSLLTLSERIQHHFTGAMSMLKVTAENRARRHRDYHEFFESSLHGVPGFSQRRYVFPPGDDPNRTSDFVDKLLAHGIEVERASRAFSSAKAHDYFGAGPTARQFPAGSYIVSLSQPLSRLANAVLEKEPFHSIPSFYDVSVWALPYNYGVEGYWTEDEAPVETEPVIAPPAVQGGVRGSQAKLAYAWPYRGNREAAAAFRMAADGFRVHLGSRSFRQNGASFEASVVVFLQENDGAAVHEYVPRLARDYGIEIHALDSGHPEEGPDLGSFGLYPIRPPSVAVLTRGGVDENAFGSFWFFFDQLYRLPFVPLPVEQLVEADLKRYTAIVIPDGGLRYTRFGTAGRAYSESIGEAGASKLTRWVEDGGTLVAIKGGVTWAAEAGLAEVEGRGRTEQTPGAIVRVKVNRPTPLTLGLPEDFYVLSRNALVFAANNERSRIVSFAEEDLKVAGYLLEADRVGIAKSEFLMLERRGEGRVVLFGEEPNLRCQWPVLHRLLFNAMLVGHLAS